MFYPYVELGFSSLRGLFKAHYRLDIHWAGKDTLFRFPVRRLLLWLGGVPINRHEPERDDRSTDRAFLL